MASPRQRALAALRESRVTVKQADSIRGTVSAEVRGHDRVHLVNRFLTGWECTCPEWRASNTCPHILAVRICTDHGATE